MQRRNEMAAPNQRELEEVRRQENLRAVKGLLNRASIKERFNAILGKKSAQFTASLVNVVSNSGKLLECDPNSMIAAAAWLFTICGLQEQRLLVRPRFLL